MRTFDSSSQRSLDKAIVKVKEIEKMEDHVTISFIIGYVFYPMDFDLLINTYNNFAKLTNKPIAIHEKTEIEEEMIIINNINGIEEKLSIRKLLLLKVNQFEFINTILSNKEIFHPAIFEETVEAVNFVIL